MYYERRKTMSTTLIQVRVEEKLKIDASKVFESLGIDTSIAIRMFLKRVILTNGIPFSMVLPNQEYKGIKGLEALEQIAKESKNNGLSEMTLEEIDAEIDAVRAKNDNT